MDGANISKQLKIDNLNKCYLIIINMEENEANEIVRSTAGSCNCSYTVVMNDGKKNRMRMYSAEGRLYIYRKGSRNIGIPMDGDVISSIAEIRPVKANESAKKERFYRNIDKTIDILSTSCMWPDLLDTLKLVKEDDYNLVTSRIHADNVEGTELCLEAYNETFQELKKLFEIDFIRQIRMCRNDYNYKHLEQEFLQFKKDDLHKYSLEWSNVFDCKVEFDHTPSGKQIGYYTELNRKCGGGRTYIMLDATHAAFREDI